jgi:hypothetical protein
MPEKTISEIISDGVTVNEALDKAFYRAVLLHRQANNPRPVRQPRTLPLLRWGRRFRLPKTTTAEAMSSRTHCKRAVTAGSGSTMPRIRASLLEIATLNFP